MTNELDSIVSLFELGEVHGIAKQGIHQVWILETSTGRYVLKRKANLEHIMSERKLLHHLRAHHVATHQMISYRQTENGDVYCLYSFLSGEASIEGTDLKRAEQMGEEIGRLHQALNSFNGASEFPDRHLYNGMFSWILKAIENSENQFIKRVAQILQDSRDEMRILETLPRQLLHRDTHGENMIFQQDIFRGFIDFDQMEINIRLFDPCYCAMANLPRGIDDVDFKAKWVSFLKSILCGYNHANPLTSDEKRCVWYVVFGIEALFVAFSMNDPHIAEKNAKICLWLAEIRNDVEKCFC